ncbi:MAG: hypothetical protein ACKVKR_15815, partial [Pseudomonadales bacterium]
MQQQAYTGIADSQGGYKQNFNKAQAGMEGMSTAGTSGALNTAQQQYLNPSANSLAGSNLNTGQNLFGQAGNLDIVGAGQGFINQAGQSSVSDVNQYMNPYQT